MFFIGKFVWVYIFTGLFRTGGDTVLFWMEGGGVWGGCEFVR